MKPRQLLLILLAALLPSITWADVWQDPETKVNYNYTLGKSEASVASSNKVSGDIIILSQFTIDENTYSVTSIGKSAFTSCSGLSSITIPNSVTSIGSSAFYGCSILTSVTIPNSVTSIGSSAFSGCSSLTSVTIPNSVTSIGSYAFNNCSGLRSVTIPNSVTSIAKCCFSGCSGLTSMNIPNSVNQIGDHAFSGCSGLTSITIPYSVNFIDEAAFTGCSGLTSITIPYSVKSIGDYAFSGCNGLTSMIVEDGNKVYDSRNNCNAIIKKETNELVFGCMNTVIPNSVTSIGSKAFWGISSLTTVTIPNSVWNIGENAFSYCRGLTTVAIGNSVTSISDYAFSNCSGLTSITIPNSVTHIGNHAFDGCRGLTFATIGNSVTDIGAYAFGSCTGLSSVTIGNSVYEIGEHAFSGCSGLTSITIPNSVKIIGDYAFENCSGLTSITIPNSVTSIRMYTFYKCFGLTSITIPNSVTSIGDNAFSGCSGLTSITIPNSVKSIDHDAFRNCSGLTSITIPNSVTSISMNTFAYCSGLTSITIPNSITSIRDNAFSGCSGLTSITIPNSVTGIGDHAFDGCSGLTSVTIPNSVTRLGYWAFRECASLTSVTIPNSVKSIGDYTFYGCSGLTSVTIPNSVTRLGYGAFRECASLTSVTIPNSVTSIGDNAFDGCSGLTSVTIGSSVTSIGYAAFSGCSGLISVMSLIMEPFSVSGVFSNDTYSSATLYVPSGTRDAYKTTTGWNSFKNIEELGGSSLDISVTNENGTDITDQVSIIWYDADGKEIGTGKSLNGIEEGTELYYSVELGEELGRIYRDVKMRKVVAKDGEAVTCQLEKIGRVTLEGRVSATDIDKTTMTVNVKQMLNGKWEQNYTVQTNEQGVFKVEEIYDDQTYITISGEGYLDATLHRDGFNGNGNLGTIPMSLISGFGIAANITIRKAVVEGEAEETTVWSEGLNNIEFTLTNKTKGATITDFTVQNGNVIIKSGANVGDEIRLTAKSKQDVFADATTLFTIAEGANAFDLQLTELGGFDATYAVSNNGSTSGYLYNSDDVLVAKGSYVGETLSLRHLQNGVYTLISMGNSTLLGSMTRLSDISAVGLTAGNDYVSNRVEVIDGELTAVNVSEVPRLDETHFYYTNNNTYFSANKASVIAGNYLTLQAHIDFKQEYADKANGVTLTVDLPEGCQMVENSVIANRQAVPHTVNGNRVTMMINKEQYGSQVRFCIIPTMNQSYTLTAMASFDINGLVTQPIGIAQFEVKGLSLEVPEQTTSTNVTINGIAKGHSEVSIYDNDVLIGKTSSKADGCWSVACELYKPYSHSFHDIYAKIITENGMELTSETQQVEYDKNRLVAEKVTMLYYNPEFVGQYNIVFDLISGTTTPSSYYYFPYKKWPNWRGSGTEPKDFTFLADFTRNDSTVIKNVNIKVLNSDGTVRTLPATFDGKQGKWVATTKYSNSGRLPKNVKVEYDFLPTAVSDNERDESIFNQATILANSANRIYQYYTDEVEMVQIKDDENVILAELRFDDKNTRQLRIENMNYAEAKQMMSEVQFIYAESNEGIIATYTLEKENEIMVIAVDLTQNVAFRISMLDSYQYANLSSRRRAAGDIWNMLSVGANNLLDIMGVADYWSVGSDFDYMMSLIARYTDAFNQMRSRTTRMITAKCPDGKNRLTPSQMEFFTLDKQYLSSLEDLFSERYYDSIVR